MRNRLIPILLILAIAAFGGAIYIGLKKQSANVQVEQKSLPETKPGTTQATKKGRLESYNPSVVISQDGKSCTLVVPAQAGDGVATDDGSKQFFLNKGDEFEIVANGSVEVRGVTEAIVGPEGEYGYWDKSVDSPFYTKVGGLEFSIGPLGANRYFAGRYYQGKSKYNGVPVFRVIESVNGYQDGNDGAFNVTIRKK